MDWIDLAKHRGRWRALVNAVMNFGFCKIRGIENLLASQEGFCSMELVN
jgi:hypothetical protein